MLLAPVQAPLAHEGVTLAESWTTLEMPVTMGIILATALYFYAIGPLREQYHWAEAVERKQVVAFLSAMAVAFVSLQGPLHILSDNYLLTAHMIQHMLITLIVPPLLLKGLPGWLIERILLLPLYLRRAIRHRWPGTTTDRLPRGPLLHHIGRLFTGPFVAYGLYNVSLLVWHVPRFYDATLTNDHIHSLMHIMFIATGLLTWWPVYSPTPQLPALNDPLQIMYLFLQSIPSTILGAIIALADVVLYPTYATAPRIGLTALQDQQIAGLIMWNVGGIFYLALISVRWFRWMGNDEASSDPVPRPQPEVQQPGIR